MGNSIEDSSFSNVNYRRALDLKLFAGASFRDYCVTKVDFLALVSVSWLLWPKIYKYGDLYLLREADEDSLNEMIKQGTSKIEIELSFNSFHILDEFAQTGTEFDLELAEDCCEIIRRSWESYLPQQLKRSVWIKRTTFEESYGPTISFHSQNTVA